MRPFKYKSLFTNYKSIMMKYLAFFLIVFAILYSCNQNKTALNGKKTLSFVESHYPDDIFPATISSSEESHIITQVHNSLLGYNTETNKPRSCLAKRWVVNNANDKIIFHLHNDVYFHDDACFENGKGRKLTAKDVKMSMEYALWYKAKNQSSIGLLKDIAGGKAFFENRIYEQFKPGTLEGIKVIDSLSVQIDLAKPNPAFIYSLMAPNMSVMPIEGLNKYGDKCMVGCGAFKVQHFDPTTDSLVLAKNKRYFRKDSAGLQLPYIDNIVVYYEATPAKSLRMIRNGKVDFMLTMQKKHVTKFLEENISLFEAKKPELVLDQADGLETTDIFLIRRSSVKNLQYSSMNVLYLEKVDLVKKEVEKPEN